MRLGHLLFLFFFVTSGTLLAQDTNFQAGPQYLVTNQSNQFLHPIATPSLSLDAPLPPIPTLPEVGPPVENQPYVSTPLLSQGPNLFPIYYGYPELPVIELISEVASEAPSTPVEVNTVVINSMASAVRTEAGDTLGELASFWKTHRAPIAYTFTNADVERLHGAQSATRGGGL